MGQPAKKLSTMTPSPYDYIDIQKYLQDVFDFLSASDGAFSLRKFAEATGVDQGHISKILSGHATLTAKVLNKMLPKLPVQSLDIPFVHHLRDLSESRTQEDRIKAFKKMLKNKRFRENNKESIVGHEFLSKWYYGAIRELARTKDFKNDPKWIRKQLNNRITASEAASAMSFLLEHGYLIEQLGQIKVAQNTIKCAGGIYRLAASKYHGELLTMARDSIHDVERDLRQIMSHTIAIPDENIVEIREILREAAEKISNLEIDENKRNSVYQVSLLAFPLTKVITRGD